MDILSRDNGANPPATNIGWRLTLVSYLLIILSAISTVLRLWARADARALGEDDWSILAGTAFAIVMSALSIVGVQHGKGQHAVYLSEAQILSVSKLSFINQIILFVALCLVKMSICFLVLRIQGNAKWLRWSLWIVMALMVVTTLEASISLLAECDPVRGYWDRGLVEQRKASCHTPEVRIYSIYVQAGYSMLTDLVCSLLPILIVWKLHLPLQKKLGICVLMAMGLTATAFAGLRAASLGGTNISDTTYTYLMTGVWITIELNLGIIAANLSTVKGWIKLFRSKVLGKEETGTYGSHTHGTPMYIKYGNHSGNRMGTAAARSGRRPSEADSDRSEIPLKGIIQTRDYIVADSGAQSIGAERESHRPWDE
ncbi:hypothetical protein D0869_00935 [Hortaea werneckii]|uniref:Rhodopsin domain-containing protein n=1 Tax=Hortaea werneckii TaxID=91943 RepID=A0A3M6ZNB3_HORWE|nr:hypothetical protein KC334_g115 [Hortaea werneckii]KAI7027727.1 hypothetical protein KC355_g225 [Hortaea werneckii]KAI7203911.1 hypothetical protein KC324_g1026 [Hortaea werneckii]KAI7594577.1 hypothetical protein KC316_g1044 [Hortaea werneckii]KAI7676157.1 hypothetical protein KC318_g445 [Hortaea werneckii]